jgi:hypothetical protein
MSILGMGEYVRWDTLTRLELQEKHIIEVIFLDQACNIRILGQKFRKFLWLLSGSIDLILTENVLIAVILHSFVRYLVPFFHAVQTRQNLATLLLSQEVVFEIQSGYLDGF